MENVAENDVAMNVDHATYGNAENRDTDPVTIEERERQENDRLTNILANKGVRYHEFAYGFPRSQEERTKEAADLRLKMMNIDVPPSVSKAANKLAKAGKDFIETSLVTETDNSRAKEFANDSVLWSLSSNLRRNIITNFRWMKRHENSAEYAKDESQRDNRIGDMTFAAQMARESAAALSALLNAADAVDAETPAIWLDAVNRVEESEIKRANNTPMQKTGMTDAATEAVKKAAQLF